MDKSCAIVRAPFVVALCCLTTVLALSGAEPTLASAPEGIYFCNPGFVIISNVQAAVGDTLQAVWVANGSVHFALVFEPSAQNLTLLQDNNTSGLYFFEVRSDGLYLDGTYDRYLLQGYVAGNYNLNITNTGTHDEAIYANLTVIHPMESREPWTLVAVIVIVVVAVALTAWYVVMKSKGSASARKRP